MNNKNNFKQIKYEDSNAVISFYGDTVFKIDKLMINMNSFFQRLVLNKISKKLNEAGLGSCPDLPINSWNEKGVEAEILEPESGEWKKGKVRMRVILEFSPDEPEDNNSSHNGNSLDDIRQTIT